MSSRIDAVSNRVQSALAMKQVTKSIGSVTKALESAMASMNLEKVSKIMDKFETEFTNLDVHTQVMEGAMSSATTLTTPQEQVDTLISQVAAEAGLDVSAQLAELQPGATLPSTSAKERTRADEDVLSKRYGKKIFIITALSKACFFFSLQIGVVARLARLTRYPLQGLSMGHRSYILSFVDIVSFTPV